METIIRRKITAHLDEQLYIVKKYFHESGGNTEHIEKLLQRTDIQLTDGTRLFIAEVLSGRENRSRKIKKSYFRDLNIYWSISERLNEGKNLTSNSEKDGEGAAYKVAKMYGITEENALKIYERMRPRPPTLEDYL